MRNSEMTLFTKYLNASAQSTESGINFIENALQPVPINIVHGGIADYLGSLSD